MKIIALTVLCVDNFVDLNKTVVGGNSLNFAYQAKKSGAEDVSVLGAVGTDSNALRIYRFLEENGFSISHITSLPDVTASNRIYINDSGDRYFKADSWTGGAFEHYRIDDKDWSFILSHNIVAVAGTDPNLEEIIRHVYSHCDIVLDFLDDRDFMYVKRKLEDIDLGFISGDEETIAELRPKAAELGIPVVVTMGDKGSVAIYKDKLYKQEAIPVPEVVDTTGCGDAFQAAFTVSWFRFHNIEEALKKGAEAAAKVLSYVGGVDGQ